MGNYLFLIGIKCNLEQLANCVSVVEEDGVEHVAYFGFWDKIAFIWYNQDTHIFTIKEIVDGEVRYYNYEKDEELFQHMDDNGIEFIYGTHSLGKTFKSYSAAYLEIIRWVADVAWTREKYNQLLGID